MSASAKPVLVTTSSASDAVGVSPLSKELVFGVVGFAGAGCTTTVRRLEALFDDAGYEVRVIKLSDLIGRQFADRSIPTIESGLREGQTKYERACMLQDLGDELRRLHGPYAVAALGVREIMRQRGKEDTGERRLLFILDSIKHSSEVELLRRVYDQSFRLVATHCELNHRERRLIGAQITVAKYRGVPEDKVRAYMERDEKDAGKKHGQQVRDAFHLADFFIDNNEELAGGHHLNDDLVRFRNLILGTGLVRPSKGERAIFHAYAAGYQSACLSRQVGAALMTGDGTIVSTGANDPPRFGGGIYDEDSHHDNRCCSWAWTDGKLQFTGCHNTRKKIGLRQDIAKWMARSLSDGLALAAHPKDDDKGTDFAAAARAKAKVAIEGFFAERAELMEEIPGIKDIVEYSRSIHAEMDALFSAARKGIPTVGTTLYCTTFPCHNCARHLVTAGVVRVHYVEPYVKSLATELHYDAIATELPPRPKENGAPTPPQDRMVVVPFTGVGPRMYEDFFVKRGELKKADGSYDPPEGGLPDQAVRLRDLSMVEQNAANLVPETRDA